MSWKNLLANRTVQTHNTGKQEIENLRELVSPVKYWKKLVNFKF